MGQGLSHSAIPMPREKGRERGGGYARAKGPGAEGEHKQGRPRAGGTEKRVEAEATLSIHI